MLCAFCDMKCPGHGRLGRHVWHEHRWEEVAGLKMVFDNSRSRKFICWCGAWVYQERVWRFPEDKGIPTLGEHLKERGGMRAHILELSLGIAKEVGR